MRHYSYLVLLWLVGVLVWVAAAHSAPEQPDRLPLPPYPFPDGQMIQPRRTPADLEPIHPLETAVPANDQCADPALLTIPLGQVASGATIVNNMDDDGPDLSSCLWGNPTNAPVYRTVWYKLIPEISGRLIIEAIPNADHQNDYDTVMAIFDITDITDPCNNLNRLACNDDANGFLSRTSAFVVQGRTYYIEIASTQLAQNGTGQLNFQAYIEAENLWQQEDAWLIDNPRSRHALVAVGEELYMIGGQTYVGNTNPFDPEPDPPIRTASLARFNTTTQTWTELAPMPPECGVNGYSNTGAAHVNGVIYLPSGFVGDENIYAPTHCTYTIATNTWSFSGNPNDENPPTQAPWPDSLAFGYAGVVADPTVNGYFVVGGLTGRWFDPPSQGAEAHNELFFYAPASNFWSARPSASVARYSHTAALVGQCPDPNAPGALVSNCVCIVGGLEPVEPGSPLEGAAQLIVGGECYDKVDQIWGPIASLNIPRFNAASAVTDDGVWYVFGGLDAGFNAVAELERYDPVANIWEIVDRRLDLSEPVRSWPRGAFVGNSLWVVGGETSLFAGAVALNLVERLDLPPATPAAYFPLLRRAQINGEPDNTFSLARRLIMWSSLDGDFTQLDDRFDVYFFEIIEPLQVTVRLTQMPSGDNYDVYIYDVGKILRGAGNQAVGNADEVVTMSLDYGRYYILVVNQDNNPLTPDSYRLSVGN